MSIESKYYRGKTPKLYKACCPDQIKSKQPSFLNKIDLVTALVLVKNDPVIVVKNMFAIKGSYQYSISISLHKRKCMTRYSSPPSYGSKTCIPFH